MVRRGDKIKDRSCPLAMASGAVCEGRRARKSEPVKERLSISDT